MTINIILGAIAIAASVVLGILLRRLLVRRLQKTVLDNWIVQTLGALVIIVPVILGLIGAIAIFNASFVVAALQQNVFKDPKPTINLSWSLIQTALILALGNGIARTLRAMMMRSLGSSRMDINMRTLMARVLYIVVLSITGFLILSVWNIPVAVPVAVLSAFTVAITVAFQDILKNLVAGFYILMERPFYIGDQINITSGMITYVGKVEDIQLRATLLRLTSGEEVSVPNLFIFSNAVINNTHFGERRSILVLTMPQEEFDRDGTTSKILLLLKEYPEVMSKPEPAVMVDGYEDGKISLQARFWVATGQMIDISQVVYELHNLFPTANISIKEPV
ncbi:mechanosensitive ion channel family protein [Dictyobacter alpinus]|nr:mechanosensitive ion channel domain-containing protein [Dictyobacter alpinus]